MDILDYKFRNLNKLFTFKENRAVRTACPVLFLIDIPCGQTAGKSKNKPVTGFPKTALKYSGAPEMHEMRSAPPKEEITGD